jgi:hypothetical protein
MNKVKLPGFTAEVSLRAAIYQYNGKGYSAIPSDGRILPQFSVVGSYCDYSTGQRWCIGMGRYHPGLLFQFSCGSCGVTCVGHTCFF